MSSKTILLVDDDDGVSEALATVLADEGYRVELAGNGEEALHHLRTNPPPSVILLDLMMPVMDGYTFRAAQLADPSLAHIPVLVATAGLMDKRVAAMRVQGQFKKPIDLDALLAALERYCT